MVAKLPVLPVSATVAVTGGVGGASGMASGTKGEPSGVAQRVQDGFVLTVVFDLGMVLVLGSPLPQVLVALLVLSW